MHHHAAWCIMMHHHASSCSIMHHDASSCIMMHRHASSCSIMQHHASSCMMMHEGVLSCIIIHHHTLSCIIMHHHASSCIIMHHHASSCIIVHHHTSSWITMHHHASSRIIMQHHAASCIIMHHVSFIIHHHFYFCIMFISSRLLPGCFFPVMPSFSVLSCIYVRAVDLCICLQGLLRWANGAKHPKNCGGFVKKSVRELLCRRLWTLFAHLFCTLCCMFPVGCVSCDAPKSSWPRSILQVQFRGRTFGLVLSASNLGADRVDLIYLWETMMWTRGRCWKIWLTTPFRLVARRRHVSDWCR